LQNLFGLLLDPARDAIAALRAKRVEDFQNRQIERPWKTSDFCASVFFPLDMT